MSSPANVQVTLGSSGNQLMLDNSFGNITLGTQVVGNGAAVVSAGNISLIGTSNNLSNSPNQALGLDLYSQNTITVNPFNLTSGGAASFGPTNLQGVVYAWQGINMVCGNSSASAPFNMTGAMVAYGGDPSSGNVTPGAANASITASTVNVTYDPSYVAGLEASGPFTLGIVSWHEL